jgi:hypothetical protein
MKKPKLGSIHRQILALMKKHRAGISEGEMRIALRIKPEKQLQFGRRRRDLHYYYRITKKRVGTTVYYIYSGKLRRGRDTSQTDAKTRALILHEAHGQCGMCGRTIKKHGVTLVIDLKIPRQWGGKTEPPNLWAICEECNQGKKNLFKSVDSKQMRSAARHESVRVRIGELLKSFGVGKPVSSHMIDIVANQDEWRKRLRDLRYLGWKIKALRVKAPGGRFQSAYRLDKFKKWPKDPDAWVSKYEKERAERNRKKRRRSQQR